MTTPFEYDKAVQQPNADGCYEWLSVKAGRPSIFSNNIAPVPVFDPIKRAVPAIECKGALQLDGDLKTDPDHETEMNGPLHVVPQQDIYKKQSEGGNQNTRNTTASVVVKTSCFGGSIKQIFHADTLQWTAVAGFDDTDYALSTLANLHGGLAGDGVNPGLDNQMNFDIANRMINSNIFVEAPTDRGIKVSCTCRVSQVSWQNIGPDKLEWLDTVRYPFGHPRFVDSTDPNRPLEKWGKSRYAIQFYFNPKLSVLGLDKTPQDFTDEFQSSYQKWKAGTGVGAKNLLFPGAKINMRPSYWTGDLGGYYELYHPDECPDPYNFTIEGIQVRPSIQRELTLGAESAVEVVIFAIGHMPEKYDANTPSMSMGGPKEGEFAFDGETNPSTNRGGFSVNVQNVTYDLDFEYIEPLGGDDFWKT